jgi:hypothetical protein
MDFEKFEIALADLEAINGLQKYDYNSGFYTGREMIKEAFLHRIVPALTKIAVDNKEVLLY